MEKSASVKLTRAILIDGKPKKAGSVVKVTEIFARELIQMNKAERSKAAPEPKEKEPENPETEPVPDPEKKPDADEKTEPAATPETVKKPKK